MIRLENTHVQGWEAAIRGMRNPMNSWTKSDSEYTENGCDIGANDMRLMMALRDAGHDHRKYLRFIVVTVDITAPLYWWKEFDTYKVGTVANSCSTMHKIAAKEFTEDDFSHEHLISADGMSVTPEAMLRMTVDILNACRKRYLETKDKTWWWQMIQLLPSSYEQRRTVLMNYEVLNNIAHSRKDHKLDEWRAGFMEWINSLPYARELILEDDAV